MASKESIAIIGSGIAGLAFAYYVQKDFPDTQIEIFEKAGEVGGLAAPFSIQGTKLEKFYHHIFTTDTSILQLIKDLGIEDKLKWYKDNRANFYNNKLYPFLSPLDLLLFNPIPFIDRLRLAAVSFYLTKTNNWKRLEKHTADGWMRKYAGEKAYDIFMKPLLYGKFQERYKDITMSWLWSRIDTRVNSKGKLGYMDGSFGEVFTAIEKEITKRGGTFHLNVQVTKIEKTGKMISVTYIDTDQKEKVKQFNKVIITTPANIYTRFLQGLSKEYIQHVTGIDYISAQTIVLTLKHQLTPYYWTSVVDTSAPALAVIEQSNITNAYNGKNVVYIGNYLQNDAEILKMNDEQLQKLYYPFLKKLNPKFSKSWVEEFRVFRAPFAQPIVTREYHTHIPSFASPVKGVYILNMSQVYPEDRGMNFAIEKALQLKSFIWKQ